MKRDITATLVNEHRLIVRMLDLLERNAQLTAAGTFRDYRFYLDGVAFIRDFADRFHHAKEEEVLFEALVANGMPREHSPVAAMLMDHDRGRAFVKSLEEAARQAADGVPGRDPLIAANALAYVALLREHIAKEDGILYPLAERVIPEEARDGIAAAYEAAESRAPAGFAAHCEAVVARYEEEAIASAA